MVFSHFQQAKKLAIFSVLSLSLVHVVHGQSLGLYPTGDPNTDYDLLGNSEEATRGTDPSLTDTDGDYITDSDEILITGTNPLLADTDQNGFSDYQDWVTANPQLWDVNKNALWDERDLQINDYSAFLEYFWWPTSLLTDYDGDGICDRDEVLFGNTSRFNYRNADSDSDGIPDGVEWNGPNRWDPTDYDHDGLTAAQETGWPISDPNNPDTDGDGLLDGADRYFGDPRYPDQDGDGLTDYFELIHNSYPYHGNYDEDYLGDALEIELGTNPVAYDTDMDGIGDGDEFVGWQFVDSTDPTTIDSDGDFLTDWEEVTSWNSASWPMFAHMELDPNNPDTDGDGLLDWQEVNLTDTDGGGVPDVFERYYGLNPSSATDDTGDLDNDGQSNLDEYLAGQLLDGHYGPHYDWDRDGMTNVWEIAHGLDPTDPNDSCDDPDGDFLLNIEEFRHRSDPNDNLSAAAASVSITYLDSGTQQNVTRSALNDYEAVFGQPLPSGLTRNNGTLADREHDDDWDGDGLTNLDEIWADIPTDPRHDDTLDDDGDGLPNTWEVAMTLDPNDDDQDHNGIRDDQDDFDSDDLTNLQELQAGTHPLNADTDEDGLPDGWEVFYTLNPTLDDQNGNQVNDGEDDFDNDSLTNIQELLNGTHPFLADTDEDGLQDGLEITLGANPSSPDTDGDGITDGAENNEGSDLNDATSVPNAEKNIQVQSWYQLQSDYWSVTDRGPDIYDTSVRYHSVRTTRINGQLINNSVVVLSASPPSIDLEEYMPPTNWGSPSFQYLPQSIVYRTYHYQTQGDTVETQSWRAENSKLQLQTSVPLTHDYKLTYTAHRHRKPYGSLLPPVITNLGTREILLAEGSLSSSTLELIYPPEEDYEDTYQLQVIPEFTPKSVSFSGSEYIELKSDDGEITYKSSHWYDVDGDGEIVPALLKPERNYPVAFVKNSKIKLAAKFCTRGFSIFDDLGFNMRAKINGGAMTLPETWCPKSSDGWISFPETETEQPLQDLIAFYNADDQNAFTIEWEYQTTENGEFVWRSAGTTKHTVYVVAAMPLTTANNLRRETLFNIGCRRANGLSGQNEGEVVDAIYGEFTDRQVARVEPAKGTLKEEAMTYWGNPSGGVASTSDLLATGDGQCGAWGRFLIDIFRTQGINTDLIEVTPLTSPSNQTVSDSLALYLPSAISFNRIKKGFYVKNWDLGVPFAPVDLSGVAGQGNLDPRAFFADHVLVRFNGIFYDPSYGLASMPNISNWEDHALEGFGENIMVDFGYTQQLKAWVWKTNTSNIVETNPQVINYQ